MPELPEVETVRRGLAPSLIGARIDEVDQRRPDLRFPFPERFAERLCGARIEAVNRRAKFLVLPLSTGEVMTAHLGMTGRFTLRLQDGVVEPGAFYLPDPPAGHEHLAMKLTRSDGGQAELSFADPRRFGFIELFEPGTFETTGRMRDLGPEPLSSAFDGPVLRQALAGRATPLKAALLDQKTVAGLGNIYVCEALFRARISPRRLSRSVGPARAERLAAAVQAVLSEAIEAGGSTLRDYAGADGQAGGFQQRFDVYDREGAPCRRCGAAIKRIVQSGRSTFFCGLCQR